MIYLYKGNEYTVVDPNPDLLVAYRDLNGGVVEMLSVIFTGEPELTKFFVSATAMVIGHRQAQKDIERQDKQREMMFDFNKVIAEGEKVGA